MTSKRWARCLDSVADVLRRGAWYPVLQETEDGHLVLDVHQRQVRLSRNDVQLRERAPDQWSVVVRTGVMRPTLGGAKDPNLTSTYAVCPTCTERHEFSGKPATLRCPRCGREASVDWSHTC